MSILTPEEQVLHKAAPEILDKVRLFEDQYPKLSGRALRAGFLADGGAVRPAHEGPPHVYYVASSNCRGGSYGMPYYIVELDGNGELKRGTCTCPDYFNGLRGHQPGAPTIHGGPKCKHILALAIVRAIEKDKERASVEVAASTEAAQCAHDRAQGSADDSTHSPDGQARPVVIGKSKTCDDHARRHNYVGGFASCRQAHPQYRARRWRRP